MSGQCWTGLGGKKGFGAMLSAAAKWQVAAEQGLLPSGDGLSDGSFSSFPVFPFPLSLFCLLSLPGQWGSRTAATFFWEKENWVWGSSPFAGWCKWMEKYGILCSMSDGAASLCLDSCHLRLTIWQGQTCTNFHIVFKAVMYYKS